MAKLRVEVIHALAGRQQVVALELHEGATAEDAVKASGLAQTFFALGIFGKRVPPRTKLEDGDRVEILRPLAIDPKEARRRRARRGSPRARR
jgi:putative ubiquitin-RnfH superfamily antitoxin RatB of RatAB toxin-antitoxin module